MCIYLLAWGGDSCWLVRTEVSFPLIPALIINISHFFFFSSLSSPALHDTKTHFCAVFSVQTGFFTDKHTTCQCTVRLSVAKWVFLGLPYMFSFHLNSRNSQQCIPSTAPCMFLYISPYCILLFPHVSLNGGYYWRIPLEVSLMCAQTYFLDVIC